MVERLITSKELAKMLGLSENTVFRHLRESKPGFPQAIRSGPRFTRFKLSEAEAYINAMAGGELPVQAKPTTGGIVPPWLEGREVA